MNRREGGREEGEREGWREGEGEREGGEEREGGREGEGERMRKCFQSTGSIPKCSQKPGLGQAEAKIL